MDRLTGGMAHSAGQASWKQPYRCTGTVLRVAAALRFVLATQRLSGVAPQEVLAADGACVRVSATVRWAIDDAQAYVERAADPAAAVYLATQVALRDALAALAPGSSTATRRSPSSASSRPRHTAPRSSSTWGRVRTPAGRRTWTECAPGPAVQEARPGESHAAYRGPVRLRANTTPDPFPVRNTGDRMPR